MPSSKQYLNYILDVVAQSNEITYKPMMGEFLLYCKGKLVGGIYDNRLLVKPVKSAIEFLKNAQYALPYEGGKQMLLVENTDDGEYLLNLFNLMLNDLPEKNKKYLKKLINKN